MSWTLDDLYWSGILHRAPHPWRTPSYCTRLAIRRASLTHHTKTLRHASPLPIVSFDLYIHNYPLPPTNIPYFPSHTHTILHQPPESQFWLIFRKNPRKVNGISVSGPPKIGERPYPRQFHPVGFPLFFDPGTQFSRPPAHYSMVPILTTPITYSPDLNHINPCQNHINHIRQLPIHTYNNQISMHQRIMSPHQALSDICHPIVQANIQY